MRGELLPTPFEMEPAVVDRKTAINANDVRSSAVESLAASNA